MTVASAAAFPTTKRSVSVILPTFNREATLGRAIASVLAQTHGDLELIVVDDGSTDGTPAVLAGFDDPRLRVIRVDRNRGANHARNLGIREARADLLAFMDSDDAWLPHKLTAQLAVMDAAMEDVGLVFSPYRRSRDGVIETVGADVVGLPHDRLRQRLLERNAIGTPTVLVKRSLVDGEHGFDAALPRLQEWELWLGLSARTRFVAVAEPLVDVFMTRDSITRSPQKHLEAMRLILARHGGSFREAGGRVLGKHLLTLGSLEVAHGDPRRGRSLLLKAVLLNPSRRAWSRLASALAGRVLGRRRGRTADMGEAPRFPARNDERAFDWLPAPKRIDQHAWGEPTPPLVTVQVITYNHGPFIRDCLEGVLKQETTFPVNVVIHDDASTDGTAEIVRAYAERHPQLIDAVLQSENLFARAISRTPYVAPYLRGAYIAVCEGDDYWVDATKLEKQVRFLEQNPDYVISCHDAFVVDANGQRIAESKLPAHQKYDHAADDLVYGRAFLPTLSWVYRNVLPFDPIPEAAMIKNRDTFTVSLLGHHGKSKFHDDVLPGAYRVHEGGIWSMQAPDVRLDDTVNTYFWIYRYYKRIGRLDVAEGWHRWWQAAAMARVDTRRLAKAAIGRLLPVRGLKRLVGRIAEFGGGRR